MNTAVVVSRRDEPREVKLPNGFRARLSLTVLCLLVAPNARADDGRQKTTVTLTDPVEVPGVGQQLLSPGTYVFRLKNSPTDRHIVEIFNQNETKVLTTLISIPDFRLKATDKPVLIFSGREAGEPGALKAWFNGGQKSGEQFVWEKSKAIQLAKESNEPVLSTNVELAAGPVEGLSTAPIEAVNTMGESVDAVGVVEGPPVEMASAAPAPLIAPQPMPAATVASPVASDSTPVAPDPAPVAADPTPVAAVPTLVPSDAQPVATLASPVAPESTAVAAEPSPAAQETATSAALPMTASDLPLIGFAGALSLSGGFLLFGLSKRRA
jgi:hypothetical protein